MTRQYIGARYVPIFFTNSDNTSEWRAGVAYEPLTIVTWNYNSYTSKKTVPSTVGNPSDNPTYWVNTGNFNAQLDELSPLASVALRTFGTVNEMQNSDIDTGVFALCSTYNNNGGEPILYIITDTSSDFSVPLINGNYADPIIDKMAVHISQFGAVGDGVTDDTDAIQNAIDYAGSYGTVIIDRKECAVSRTIVVSEFNVNIIGSLTAEYRSTIAIPNGSTVSPVIDVQGKVFTMRGVHLYRRLVNRQSLSGIAIRIKRPDPSTDSGWYNMDAYIEKCVIMGFGVGADCYGRNIIFRDDTHFSNCLIGVHYHSKNGSYEEFSRGWIVENCRFHSMGNEQSYSDPATCPCIAVKTDLNAITREIIIKNNVFDGNCNCMMFYGSTDGLIIDGNTVESTCSVIIGYLKRPVSTVNNYPVIQNNVIIELTAPNLGIYTDVMLYFAGARFHFVNNTIRTPMKHFMKCMQLDTGQTSLNHNVISGNTFWMNQSNTDFTDPATDVTLQYVALGNVFFSTGGASGITLSANATIENSGNVNDCNVKDSAYTY